MSHKICFSESDRHSSTNFLKNSLNYENTKKLISCCFVADFGHLLVPELIMKG